MENQQQTTIERTVEQQSYKPWNVMDERRRNDRTTQCNDQWNEHCGKRRKTNGRTQRSNNRKQLTK